LPDPEHFDYGGFKAYATSFKTKDGKIDFSGLRKSEQLLSILSDEECRKKFDDQKIIYDNSIQTCTYIEFANATGQFDGVIFILENNSRSLEKVTDYFVCFFF
jgi:hypothetical protein